MTEKCWIMNSMNLPHLPHFFSSINKNKSHQSKESENVWVGRQKLCDCSTTFLSATRQREFSITKKWAGGSRVHSQCSTFLLTHIEAFTLIWHSFSNHQSNALHFSEHIFLPFIRAITVLLLESTCTHTVHPASTSTLQKNYTATYASFPNEHDTIADHSRHHTTTLTEDPLTSPHKAIISPPLSLKQNEIYIEGHSSFKYMTFVLDGGQNQCPFWGDRAKLSKSWT